MQIPEKIMAKWMQLKSGEDVAKIAETNKVSGQTIRNAFNNGYCTDEVFKMIGDFYQQKLELIKEYM